MSRNHPTKEQEEYIRDNLRYDPDTGDLWWTKAGKNRRLDKPAGHVKSCGRKRVQVQGLSYGCHRIAFFLIEGWWPDEVDHINRNHRDNRWLNLRPANKTQNAFNKVVRGKMPRGVFKNHKRYSAALTAYGQRHYLGTYDTPEEAHSVYLAKCKAIGMEMFLP